MELTMKTPIPTLINYIKGMPTNNERVAFAIRCGTTLGYLKLVMYGNRNCNAALAIAIDRESKSAVVCDDLCPNVDFAYLRKQATSA